MRAHRSVHTAWGEPQHDRKPALAQVGALVWGFVRRIESYGALIGLDNTRISGLLHISLVSRAHVEDIYVSAPLHLAQDFSPCLLCAHAGSPDSQQAGAVISSLCRVCVRVIAMHTVSYSLRLHMQALQNVSWEDELHVHRCRAFAKCYLDMRALYALQDVFEEGERVRCLITNVDQESQRISLSTADLEETTGDMLMDKVRFAMTGSN